MGGRGLLHEDNMFLSFRMTSHVTYFLAFRQHRSFTAYTADPTPVWGGGFEDILPSVTISGIYIHTELYQEFHDLGVAGTHSVVESCDAFIVRQARVIHLGQKEEEWPLLKFLVTWTVPINQLFRFRTEIGSDACGVFGLLLFF